ncbi:polymorphic toxin type 4 domain-containing protein [Vibrio nigripulchritudo]|uniref:polymorphic toxin type 4 domain-containing protein n=1 Tax=Vibrio nigripulchritudo TaxID=28173 RepID=UPI0024923655|nr:polymorphic toxin type 4 domain-containing protein [Vibrio nigripulchritudo]BDU40789.1 hypothetical protein TUMSATVNIG2_52580 [Vibrio nigripulchritudo]BDU46526.1 hypothetical protein TUMSATVNIG3_53240 [Vibrio nigripulchritudo]
MASKVQKGVAGRKVAKALDLTPPLKISKIVIALDTITMSLRKRLMKSKNASTKGMSKAVSEYSDALKAAKKRGAYLRAKKMLNSATKPVKAILDIKDKGDWLPAAPKNAKIWLSMKLDQKKWAQTRLTGAIQEMRAIIFPNKQVQFDIAGEVKPSISSIRGEKGMDFKDELPSPSKKRYNGHSLKGFERAHLWGHGFGDEAKLGLMYAPKALNQEVQGFGIEMFIRDLQLLAQHEGRKVFCHCRALSHPPKGKSNLSPGKGELLISDVFYEVTYEAKDGRKIVGRFVASISEPPESKVLIDKDQSLLTEI